MTTTNTRASLGQQAALVAFGLLLGGALAAGLWWMLRRPPCEPVMDAMAATSAVQMYKEPCARFQWTLADPGYTPHTVQYNGFGMHDEPVTFDKPPNTTRILIMGDSYAQGLQLPMEQGFPDLLEANLNDSSSATRYEVINLSVDTLGTDRLLMLYALLGYRFEADVVLLATYVGNDVQNNSIELAALRNEGYRPRPFFRLDSGGNLRLYNWQADLPEVDAPAPAWLRRAYTDRGLHYRNAARATGHRAGPVHAELSGAVGAVSAGGRRLGGSVGHYRGGAGAVRTVGGGAGAATSACLLSRTGGRCIRRTTSRRGRRTRFWGSTTRLRRCSG